MKTILVVDGYNAVHLIPKALKLIDKSLKHARDYIVQISKDYIRLKGNISDVKVVFDGNEKYSYLEKISNQVFSKTGQGDDTIIATVKKYLKSSKVVIASNDNYVRNNCRNCGAKLIFVDELTEKNKKQNKKIIEKDNSKQISNNIKIQITREYRKNLGL